MIFACDEFELGDDPLQLRRRENGTWEIVNLAKTDIRILLELVTRPKLHVNLWETVWESREVAESTVSAAVGRLKAKLGDFGKNIKPSKSEKYAYCLDFSVRRIDGFSLDAEKPAATGEVPGLPTGSFQDRYIDHFYHLWPNFASALRLVGADDECFLANTVRVTWESKPYAMPKEFQEERQSVLSKLEEDARRNGRMFYDGPSARLLDFRATPVEQTEQKHLDLTLGPIGWHDYSVVEYIINELLNQHAFGEISKHVPLDDVALSANLKNVRLTNILNTSTIPVTSDGRLIYMHRSQRVSSDPGKISAVDENIHSIKDRESAYRSPDPFRTVMRGLEEELSPSLREIIDPGAIYLLGICFSLEGLHPSLLFIVALAATFDDVVRRCRDYPGKDFIEGKMASTPIQEGNRDLERLLASEKWLPAGKASLIRSIEFLNSLQARTSEPMKDILASLARAQVPGNEKLKTN